MFDIFVPGIYVFVFGHFGIEDEQCSEGPGGMVLVFFGRLPGIVLAMKIGNSGARDGPWAGHALGLLVR